jgi:hypothetical protein
VPPSVVWRIVPEAPTAVPVFASVKQTPHRSAVVPLVCANQFAPPSLVRTITPAVPTAVPVFALVKKTELSCSLVTVVVMLVQLLP